MSTDALVCSVCNGVFRKPPGRGRPPSKCRECVENPPEREEIPKPTPQERVELLEIMLKSRGNHISQNRGDYD